MFPSVKRSRGDVCLAHSTEIQLWGQGEGLLLRDGRQYPFTWHRHNRPDMLTFLDANSDPVPLQIGNSWFQIVPLHYTNPVTVIE